MKEEITFLQRAWLHSRGGRTVSEVFFKNGRPAIYMNDSKGEDVIEYIPSDESIKRQNLFSQTFLTSCSNQFRNHGSTS